MGDKNLKKKRLLTISNSDHCFFPYFLMWFNYFFLRKICSTSEHQPGDQLPSFPDPLCHGCSLTLVLHRCCCCPLASALLKHRLRAQHQGPHKHRGPSFHAVTGCMGDLRALIVSLQCFTFCLQCVFHESIEKKKRREQEAQTSF